MLSICLLLTELDANYKKLHSFDLDPNESLNLIPAFG